MAFSMKILLDTTPVLAANSAISLRRAKAAGPARPNVSWLSGTNRHAPLPLRRYLSRLSESFPLAVAPVSRAAALTAAAANGSLTHLVGFPRRGRRLGGWEVPRSHPSPSAATAPATAAPRRIPHRHRHARNALGQLGVVAGARGPPSGPGAPRLASHAYPARSDGSATAHARRNAVAGKLPHTHTHTRYTDVLLYCCNVTRRDVAYGATGWSQRVFTRWVCVGAC